MPPNLAGGHLFFRRFFFIAENEKCAIKIFADLFWGIAEKQQKKSPTEAEPREDHC